MLAGLGTFVLILVYKLTLKLIKCGGSDQDILKDYEKHKEKKKSCAIECMSSILLCAFLVVAFIFSMYAGCDTTNYNEDIPAFNVVRSSSMSVKNEKNEYLFKNNLNNQLETFDLILIHKKPKQEELKKYDIVVYEIDNVLVIHRIVNIEEPNEKHPDERWFLLQGDAISQADRFPVKYEQIKGIYKDQKVPFIGSFILFMQSPFGYMCMILVALAIIFTPIFEKSIEKATKERLDIILSTNHDVELALTAENGNQASQDSEEVEYNWKSRLSSGYKDNRTFMERLDATDKAKNYYYLIENKINELKYCRVIDGKVRTFKSKNVPIVKFAVRGKTLNAYLSLNPQEFVDSKYIFTDVSSVKKFANYMMRVKITSDRQVKWTIELLEILYQKYNLEKLPQVIDWRERLKNSKRVKRTFKQKLRGNQKAKKYYNLIEEKISELKHYRIIDGATRTFKSKATPIVKLAIRGKTLNAYLSLDPQEFVDSKYIFTDLSNVKKFNNYKMRVKITSDRQVKWTIELLETLFIKNNLIRGEKDV